MLAGIPAHLERHRGRLAVACATGAVAAGVGIFSIEGDPSLLSYFAPGSDLRRNLERVDRDFGSSPLRIMMTDSGGQSIDDDGPYERLENLQSRIEQDPAVATAISLPLLVQQAESSSWLADLFATRGMILGKLESAGQDSISRAFLTADRRRTLIRAYMRESDRQEDRSIVVSRIEEDVRTAGFVPELVGGAYVLQDRLADLVRSSVVRGVIALVSVLALIAWGLARSFRVVIASLAGILLVPLWLLGIVGHFGIVFDVIAAPAVNVAIGLGADGILHIIAFVRRNGDGRYPRQTWDVALRHLTPPVLQSGLIVVTGFALFGLSAFPPTQRFGLSIALGTAMAVGSALVVFPAVAKMLLGAGRSR